MKVKIIKRDGYGDRNGILHKCDAIVDFPDALAQKLIVHRIAVLASQKAKEPAMLEATENVATVRRPRGRPRKGPVTTQAFSPRESEE